MAFKGAIFDLDGVIVDTVPLHFEAWRKLFEEDYQLRFDLHTYEQKVDGKPRLDGVKAMLPKLTPAQQEQAGLVKQGYYVEMLQAGKLKVFDSSLQFINELLQHGIKLVGASSSQNAPDILASIGLLDQFVGVVSGKEIQQGKPHPEIFLKAAQILELATNECVVFEDAKVGVEAAKAGGFFCVGIDRHDRQEHFLQADIRLNDLANLKLMTLQQALATP